MYFYIILIFLLVFNGFLFSFVESRSFPNSYFNPSNVTHLNSNSFVKNFTSFNKFFSNRNSHDSNYNLYNISANNGTFQTSTELKYEDSLELRGKHLIIVCNWKCYLNNELSNKFIRLYGKLRFPRNIEIITCPSSIHLNSMVSQYRELNSSCVPCSQNVSDRSKSFGPYTGEITAGMLKDLGVNWTIVGHRESEISENTTIKNTKIVNKKVINAFNAGLNVILCIGEPENFDSNIPKHLSQELKECLKGVNLNGEQRLVVAYEPQCSVGTEKPADPELVSKVIEGLRQSMGERGRMIKFIYGGSIDGKNAVSYLKRKGIDGIMVGRAAQEESFMKMLENITKMSND